jgi:ankyrin repeat protein
MFNSFKLHPLRRTYFQTIIKNNNIQNVSPLLRLVEELGFKSLDEVNDSGRTPLDTAVRNKDLQAVELLLQYGADANKALDTLNTAVRNKDLQSVRLLLQYGTNPNNVYDTLDTAIKNKDLEAVELLLQYGAKPNNVYDTLDTAIKNKDLHATKLLVDYGADIKLLNKTSPISFDDNILVKLAYALVNEKVILLSILFKEDIQQHKDLIISALTGQLVKENDVNYINNAIQIISNMYPETNMIKLIWQAYNGIIVDILKVMKDAREILGLTDDGSKVLLNMIKQGIDHKSMPEDFLSLEQFISNLRINLGTLEGQSYDILEQASSFNAGLSNIYFEHNSLKDLSFKVVLKLIGEKRSFDIESLARPMSVSIMEEKVKAQIVEDAKEIFNTTLLDNNIIANKYEREIIEQLLPITDIKDEVDVTLNNDSLIGEDSKNVDNGVVE